MLFSVIYEADIGRVDRVEEYAPPHTRRDWQLTESGPTEDGEGGKHRKWCALLTRQKFEDFVSHCSLVASGVQTMGSIGAPGFGIGWAPAMCFEGGDSYTHQSAYVTPIPKVRTVKQFQERDVKRPLTDRDWKRLTRVIEELYG